MGRRPVHSAAQGGDNDQSGIVPAGAPGWVTAELIQQTLKTWQPYYSVPLTPEDALSMILSVGQLYQTLAGESQP